MKNLFSSLFQIVPTEEFSFYTEIIALSLILIVGAVIFSGIYNKKKKTNIAFKKTYRNISKSATTFGIIFLILTGLRYEQIPFFSMRLWMYATAAFFAYKVASYTYITVKKYPEFKKEMEVKKKKAGSKKSEKQYLPNK